MSGTRLKKTKDKNLDLKKENEKENEKEIKEEEKESIIDNSANESLENAKEKEGNKPKIDQSVNKLTKQSIEDSDAFKKLGVAPGFSDVLALSKIAVKARNLEKDGQISTNADSGGRFSNYYDAFAKIKINITSELNASKLSFDGQSTFGYRAGQGETTFIVPNVLSPKLLDDIKPLLVPKTKFAINEEDTYNSGLSVSTDLQINQLVIDQVLKPSQDAFHQGMGISYVEFNTDIMKGMIDGIPIGPPLYNVFIVKGTSYDPSNQIVSVIIGMLMNATVVGSEYDGIPVIHSNKIIPLRNIPRQTLPFLGERIGFVAFANPGIIQPISPVRYIREALAVGIENFKFGHVANMVMRSNVVIVSRWATTLDNYAIDLIGISANSIFDNRLAAADYALYIKAHAVIGTYVEVNQGMLDLASPILRINPIISAHQLCYAIARQPGLRSTIQELYLTSVRITNILKPANLTELDSEISEIPGTSAVISYFRSRISAGSFDSLIRALTYEIAPTFEFASIEVERGRDFTSVFFMMLETVLFFIFFPKIAKFAAYELSNGIREVMKKFFSDQWTRYVDQTGYIHGVVGSDREILRDDYLSNNERPSLLYGPAANRGSAIMARISALIIPGGQLVYAETAVNAGFPRIDTHVYYPYSDPGDRIDQATNLTGKLNQIVQFFRGEFLDQFVRATKMTTALKMALSKCVTLFADRVDKIVIMLGVGVNRATRHMRNYATNIVQSYDGRLDTDIPGILLVCDGDLNKSRKFEVQSTKDRLQARRPLVWTIGFFSEGSFQSESTNMNPIVDPITAEFQPPTEVLFEHLNFIGYCEITCKAAGIIQLLEAPEHANRPGIIRIHELLLRSGAQITSLSAGAFKSLEKLLLKIINDKAPDNPFGSDLETSPMLSGDPRINRPELRRANRAGQPTPPDLNDPEPLQGEMRLLSDRFRDSYLYSLDILGDINSPMCRFRRGFGIIRQSEPQITLDQLFNDRGWIQVILTPDMFTVREINNAFVLGFLHNGQFYIEGITIPQMIIVITEPERFSIDKLAIICDGVRHGNLGIRLPDAMFRFSVGAISRDSYARTIKVSIEFERVILDSAHGIISIPMFQTFALRSQGTEIGTALVVRYYYPLEPLNIPILFKNALLMEQDIGFEGPPARIYDTGTINDRWVNRYTNGIQKTYTSVSLANEIIVYELKDGIFEAPTCSITLPNTLNYE